MSRDNTYQYNFDFLKTEFQGSIGKKLQDITTTIKDALKIIGKPASSTIQILVDEQFEKITEYPIINEINHGHSPFGMENINGQEDVKFYVKPILSFLEQYVLIVAHILKISMDSFYIEKRLLS